MEELKLVLGNNDIFFGDKEILKHSVLIKNLFDEVLPNVNDEVDNASNEVDNASKSNEVPLPNVNDGKIMRIIYTWCKAHYKDKPLDDKQIEEFKNPINGIDPSIDKFLCDHCRDNDGNFSNEIFFNLISSVIFLDIEDLKMACLKKLATIIDKTNSIEELRTFLGVENDFTPEEEEQIRKENEWIVD
jgi:S-phase kinase-associated protein 1